MNLFYAIQLPGAMLPEKHWGPYRVVGLLADPDHFVVEWCLQNPEHPPGWPVLVLGNLAAESLLMAAQHGRQKGPLPVLLSLKTDYFDYPLSLKGVVAEVDRIHQSRGILSLEAYLYHDTEHLLVKAAATFTVPTTL